eukprot:Gb_23766 [translate_table: standard]
MATIYSAEFITSPRLWPADTIFAPSSTWITWEFIPDEGPAHISNQSQSHFHSALTLKSKEWKTVLAPLFKPKFRIDVDIGKIALSLFIGKSLLSNALCTHQALDESCYLFYRRCQVRVTYIRFPPSPITLSSETGVGLLIESTTFQYGSSKGVYCYASHSLNSSILIGGSNYSWVVGDCDCLGMGYRLCRADSAVIICESYKKERPVKIELFPYKELEIATGSFGGERLLGRGSHGCVYKGVLDGGKLVAVKKLSCGLRVLEDERAFANEIEILSKLHSPRLVNLVGVSHDSKERLLVVEFMANGTLHDILHCNPEPPSWSRRVHIALQTAKAIQALHNASPPVIHRDIKSSNVLIDDNWNARLGDFGLALRGHIKDIKLNSTPPAGTIGYLDPAYTTPANLSTKNDVFSFGILLLEIISSRNAIDVQYDPPSIVDWALPLIKQNQTLGLCDPRIRPPKSVSAIKHIATIAARCIRSAKEKRPSINEVVEELKLVNKSIPLLKWNGLTSRIKKPNVRQEKPYTTIECAKKPLGKGSSRSTRVSHGNARIDVGKISHEPGTTIRQGRRRILLDLLSETTESSETKSADWQALAKGSSIPDNVLGVTQQQQMLIRSTSLPAFGDQGKGVICGIVRMTSVNAAKKSLLIVNPSLRCKQELQATVSV